MDRQLILSTVLLFGRNGEFAEKYLHKGTKILAEGRIQTGSYTNKDGVKVYTTEVVVENQEFAESKMHRVTADMPTPVRVLHLLRCLLMMVS